MYDLMQDKANERFCNYANRTIYLRVSLQHEKAAENSAAANEDGFMQDLKNLRILAT